MSLVEPSSDAAALDRKVDSAVNEPREVVGVISGRSLLPALSPDLVSADNGFR